MWKTLQQARKLAQQAFGEVAAGRDPIAERQDRRAGSTVADLAGRYLEQHARTKKKPSSLIRAVNRALRTHS